MTSQIQYRAHWIVPGDQPPIYRGSVRVAGGVVQQVGSKSGSASHIVDLGDVILLPGFINSHAHLEFSSLPNPFAVGAGGFANWIEQVIEFRQKRDALSQEDAQSESIRAGLAESKRMGTAAIGEIATSPWPRQAYVEEPESIVFLEQLGAKPEQAPERMRQVREFLQERSADRLDESTIFGISPHAPYSLGSGLFRELIDVAVAHRLPVAMHLAETQEEMEWLRTKSGPLAKLIEGIGVPRDLQNPLSLNEYLSAIALASRALIVHGNYLTPSEWGFIGERSDRLSVVYCPRTHRHFGHSEYPLHGMNQAGVRVIVGTDSKASSPDLDVLEELRVVRRMHPTVGAREIVSMATTKAAEALGIDDRYGAIAPGKRDRLLAVKCPPDLMRDPLEWLLADQPVERTWVSDLGIR